MGGGGTMSDTLLHRWTQPDPVGDPTRWSCSCLIEHRGTPPALLCPDRVAQLQADLIDARRKLEAARAKVAELEDDMHLRIREGYDRTVADAWRAEVARVTAERDAERARVAELEAAAEDASQIPPLPGDPQGTRAFVRWLLSKPQFQQQRMLLATQEGQRLQQRAEAAERALAAEHEAHAALRGRIEGLVVEFDGIEEGAEGDRLQHECRRRPRSASQAQGVASASKHAASRLRALLTPGPKPRICRCGTPESDEAWEEGVRGCPRCGRPWPECLTAPGPEPSTDGERERTNRPCPWPGGYTLCRHRLTQCSDRCALLTPETDGGS